MPSNSIMRLRFRPKLDFTVMAQNHGVDHLGSTLWTMGSHWVKKKGQNRKKIFEFSRSSISTKIRLYGYGAKSRWGLPRVHLGSKNWVTTVKNCHTPKFEFSTTPRSSISTKTVMAQNHGADHLGSTLWPMGFHWVQKSVTTVKNYHAPKFEFSTTPRSSISTKIRLYGYGAKSRCRPPRVHFVANGVGLGPLMGHHRKKLQYPQIRIFG